MDAGGTLGAISFVDELSTCAYIPYAQGLTSTNAADCMKQHIAECVDFVADLHTITKIKVRALFIYIMCIYLYVHIYYINGYNNIF